MSDHFRPRLVRHVRPSNSQFCSSTLPQMLLTSSRCVTTATNHSTAVNVNMAFEDRPALDTYGPGSRGHTFSNHYRTTSSPDTSDKTYDQVLFDILKVDPESFAREITLVELTYFKAIEPEEFLSFKWNGKDKMEHAPNIVASTKWFNQINFWVQREILNVHNVSKRAEVMAHFIKIAKKLIELNNLYSAMAIVSALQVECIYRLKATWAALSSKDRSSYRRLDDLFHQEDNYSRLREHTAAMKLPCIPYLGMYLSDLTYINVAHPSQGEMEPQTRMDKINNILRVITDFQQSEYPFQHVDYIFRYLKSQQYIEELQKFLEDDNYKCSLQLERDESALPPPAPQHCSSDTMDPKWSPPKWGDAHGTQSCKHGIEEGRTFTCGDDAGLPQPLFQVTLPGKLGGGSTGYYGPVAYSTSQSETASSSLVSASRASSVPPNQHKQAPVTVTTSSVASSGNTVQTLTIVPSGHRKTQSVGMGNFHLSPSVQVNRSLSVSKKGADDVTMGPKLHLLDDSLLDSPVNPGAQSSGGRGYPRRVTDTPDLSLVAVVAAASAVPGMSGSSSSGGDLSGQNMHPGGGDAEAIAAVAGVAAISPLATTPSTPDAGLLDSDEAARAPLARGSESSGEMHSMQRLCQGCLQRKTVLKKGRKTRFPLWHRFWVVLMESKDNCYLVYFEPNSLRATRRKDFRTKQYQVQPLRGLLTLRTEDSRATSFRLIDPVDGVTYKFRGVSKATGRSEAPGSERLCFDALEWFDLLTGTIRKLDEDTGSDDLIQLGDS